MKILITAFEPFGKSTTNQSAEICNALAMDHIEYLLLPVLFEGAYSKVKAYIEDHNMTHVIALGEGPVEVPSVEHVAMNMMHARIPDNAGYQPKLAIIDQSVPIALLTSFPIQRVVDKISPIQLKHEHSFHAGTYVCNDLYYRLLRGFPNIKSVFIHVSNRKENFQANLQFVREFVQQVVTTLGAD